MAAAAPAAAPATRPTAATALAALHPNYFKAFLRGVVESLDAPGFLSYCLRADDVLAPTVKCFAMNLALVVTVGLLTTLSRGTPLEWVVFFSWQVPMRLATDVCGFYGWTLYPPMFYAAQEERNRRRGTQQRKMQQSGSYMGEKALRTLMQLAATLLKVAVSLVPTCLSVFMGLLGWLGIAGGPLSTPILLLVWAADWVVITPMCFVLDALVYSFFCFELRLEQQGRDVKGVRHPFKLSELLALFESAWPYYVGYGFVQFFGQRALVLCGYPVLASCLYAVLMPMNVVTSLEASPGPMVPARLPLFSRMCVVLGKRLAKLAPGRREAAAAAVNVTVTDGETPE